MSLAIDHDYSLGDVNAGKSTHFYRVTGIKARCPFCGSKVDAVFQAVAISEILSQPFRVSCESCGCEGPSATKLESAVSLWEKRADETWTEIQKRKPLSIRQRFGLNGPTPDQLAAHKQEMRDWEADVRRHKKAAM